MVGLNNDIAKPPSETQWERSPRSNNFEFSGDQDYLIDGALLDTTRPKQND